MSGAWLVRLPAFLLGWPGALASAQLDPAPAPSFSVEPVVAVSADYSGLDFPASYRKLVAVKGDGGSMVLYDVQRWAAKEPGSWKTAYEYRPEVYNVLGTAAPPAWHKVLFPETNDPKFVPVGYLEEQQVHRGLRSSYELGDLYEGEVISTGGSSWIAGIGRRNERYVVFRYDLRSRSLSSFPFPEGAQDVPMSILNEDGALLVQFRTAGGLRPAYFWSPPQAQYQPPLLISHRLAAPDASFSAGVALLDSWLKSGDELPAALKDAMSALRSELRSFTLPDSGARESLLREIERALRPPEDPADGAAFPLFHELAAAVAALGAALERIDAQDRVPNDVVEGLIGLAAELEPLLREDGVFGLAQPSFAPMDLHRSAGLVLGHGAGRLFLWWEGGNGAVPLDPPTLADGRPVRSLLSIALGPGPAPLIAGTAVVEEASGAARSSAFLAAEAVLLEPRSLGQMKIWDLGRLTDGAAWEIEFPLYIHGDGSILCTGWRKPAAAAAKTLLWLRPVTR